VLRAQTSSASPPAQELEEEDLTNDPDVVGHLYELDENSKSIIEE
jgi:hypothetical protein